MESVSETGLGGLFSEIPTGHRRSEKSETLESASEESASEESAPRESPLSSGDERSVAGVSLKAEDLVHRLKSELYELAQEMQIEGRGTMSRSDLLLALTRTPVTEGVERILTADLDALRSMATEERIKGRGKMNMADLQEALIKAGDGGDYPGEGSGGGAKESSGSIYPNTKEKSDLRSYSKEQEEARHLVEIYVNPNRWVLEDGLPENLSLFLGYCTESRSATISTMVYFRREKLEKEGEEWTKKQWTEWLGTEGVVLKQSLGEGQRSKMYL